MDICPCSHLMLNYNSQCWRWGLIVKQDFSLTPTWDSNRLPLLLSPPLSISCGRQHISMAKLECWSAGISWLLQCQCDQAPLGVHSTQALWQCPGGVPETHKAPGCMLQCSLSSATHGWLKCLQLSGPSTISTRQLSLTAFCICTHGS